MWVERRAVNNAEKFPMDYADTAAAATSFNFRFDSLLLPGIHQYLMSSLLPELEQNNHASMHI